MSGWLNTEYSCGLIADAKLDSAATILRMLYIKDLRALQSLIDRTIVEVQEFTANPRTDTALGRVGR